MESSFKEGQLVFVIASGERCIIKRKRGSVLTLSCVNRIKQRTINGFSHPSLIVHDDKVISAETDCSQCASVRRLTNDEISRFNSAEENEARIKSSYGEYGEFDSIREGQWIMGVGIFSDSGSVL
jgi:hypothetical protein